MRVCPECFSLYGPDQGPCPKDGAQTVDHTEVLIGLNLGPYIVRSQISEGGMGVVYAGEHPTLGRRVALKVLRPELSLRDDIVERFTQEARAVNTIGNRNIVNIYDFGRTPYGSFYIVMEYLDGVTVRRLLDASGPQPIERVKFVVEQVGEALGAAHEKGFIHRDVKPENIMICSRGGQEYVKLLDFGIAKLQSAHRRTATGSAMGTPQYMPPEQLEDGQLDTRTDIYAFGAVIYEMLTGRVPYAGTSHAQVRQLQVTQAPPPPSVCRRDIRLARSVDAAVLRALNLSPDDRYFDAAELVKAFHAGYDDTIAERGLAPRPGNASRLRFGLLSLLLGGLVAAAGVTAVLLLTKKPAGGSGTGTAVASASGTGRATGSGSGSAAGEKMTLPQARAAARTIVEAALRRQRAKVIGLLGDIGRHDYESDILDALDELGPRNNAIPAIGALGKLSKAGRARFIRFVRGQTDLTRRESLEVLARLGDKASTRYVATRVLKKLGKGAELGTVQIARDGVYIALATIGDKRGIRGLARHLDPAFQNSRHVDALAALARGADAKRATKAKRLLLAAARKGDLKAAVQLASIDRAAALSILRQAANSTIDPATSVNAAEQLARRLEDATAAPVLLKSLQKANETRAKQIAVGLGRLLVAGKLDEQTRVAAQAALISIMQREGDAKLAAAVALVDKKH
ncbi:MAG: serine/threonine protein kinase [Myxococcales bacterium]|nr:serine/threonine protein kinase [Myxococcales bacterium]